MRAWTLFFTFFVALFYLSAAIAKPSIEGNWITIDDKTGARRVLAHLSVQQDVLNGTIVSVFPQPGDTGICSECPGEFKNKSVKGLQFVWGLTEESPGVWSGGHILDAKTGKIYRVKMALKGKKLYVRGYVGITMMGRTQIWVRE